MSCIKTFHNNCPATTMYEILLYLAILGFIGFTGCYADNMVNKSVKDFLNLLINNKAIISWVFQIICFPPISSDIFKVENSNKNSIISMVICDLNKLIGVSGRQSHYFGQLSQWLLLFWSEEFWRPTHEVIIGGASLSTRLGHKVLIVHMQEQRKASDIQLFEFYVTMEEIQPQPESQDHVHCTWIHRRMAGQYIWI